MYIAGHLSEPLACSMGSDELAPPAHARRLGVLKRHLVAQPALPFSFSGFGVGDPQRRLLWRLHV